MDRKKSKIQPGDDAKFEAFLKKQFAELRAELDSQIAKGSAKAGKVVDLANARDKRAAGASMLGVFDKWKYGIAAAVIVAVAVPMVLQLNRQKAELANQATAPSLEQGHKSGKTLQDRVAEREEGEADVTRRSGEIQDNKNYYGKKAKVAPAKDARDAFISDDLKGRRDKLEESPRGAPTELAAGRSEGYVTKEEARAPEQKQTEKAAVATRSRDSAAMAAAPADKEERSVAAGAPASAAPASPAPAQVFAAKKRSAAPVAESEAKRDAASKVDADEAPAAKPRSFSLDDTNAKLKKQNLAEEEKAEMEKLWKDYEKDPKAFNKDQNRSARLRTLLARHDTKSRARRMISK